MDQISTHVLLVSTLDICCPNSYMKKCFCKIIFYIFRHYLATMQFTHITRITKKENNIEKIKSYIVSSKFCYSFKVLGINIIIIILNNINKLFRHMRNDTFISYHFSVNLF